MPIYNNGGRLLHTAAIYQHPASDIYLLPEWAYIAADLHDCWSDSETNMYDKAIA